MKMPLYQKTTKKKSHKAPLFLGVLVGFLLIGVGLIWNDIRLYEDRFYPDTLIANQQVGGMTLQQAEEILDNAYPAQPEDTVTVAVGDVAISSSSAQLEIENNLDTITREVFAKGHQGPWWQRVYQVYWLKAHQINPQVHYQYNHNAVDDMIAKLAQQTDQAGTWPTATLTPGETPLIEITNGSSGTILNQEEARKEVHSLLEKTGPQTISLSPTPHGQVLTDVELSAAQARAENWIGTSAEVTAHELGFQLQDQELVRFLAFPEGFNQERIQNQISSWESAVNRDSSDAEFEYDLATKKVTTFVPHRDGLALDTVAAQKQFIQLLTDIEASVMSQSTAAQETDSLTPEFTTSLAVNTTSPEITLADTNDLGVVERISVGSSNYAHSIPNRIHNVDNASSIITNTLVAPGEEFSFNKALGDVDSSTGFRSAYIIQDGQTVLADGGGVCQVSTTLFRSLLDSGLPITKRRAHSYRVGYYEQGTDPGFDATVYSGDVDLRFINDTGKYIVIHSETNRDDLSMFIELYGTDLGRTTEITDYKQWNSRPPLPTEYIPTDELPTGVKKQIDWSAPGLSTSFKHIVRNADGEIISEQEYVSHYRPWAAKFLVGI